ncbi:uncharacterized protein LOC142645004 [Dermatophagoides pteronyssinus]|uniref:uncharacterized protein LOC142645004 n=1 Tax=Dermatophagoides pteronyssinus TaxID=6956 RepID=UPI003F66C314
MAADIEQQQHYPKSNSNETMIEIDLNQNDDNNQSNQNISAKELATNIDDNSINNNNDYHRYWTTILTFFNSIRLFCNRFIGQIIYWFWFRFDQNQNDDNDQENIIISDDNDDLKLEKIPDELLQPGPSSIKHINYQQQKKFVVFNIDSISANTTISSDEEYINDNDDNYQKQLSPNSQSLLNDALFDDDIDDGGETIINGVKHNVPDKHGDDNDLFVIELKI